MHWGQRPGALGSGNRGRRFLRGDGPNTSGRPSSRLPARPPAIRTIEAEIEIGFDRFIPATIAVVEAGFVFLI
jgi:hypothetical protein